MASPTTSLESLEKSLRIYRGLVEVSGLINSITDFDDLLRAVLEVARQVMRAEAGSLLFVNERTGDLDLAIASYNEGEFVTPRLSVPKGRGIAGWVYEHRESLLIPDAYADGRFYRDADRATGFRTRSILCAPLMRDGEIIGVLQLLNAKGRDSFGAEDLEGFVAYSNLIATAIEKLRALERARAQERVERDLAIAAEIQEELLSRAIPPGLDGVVFHGYNRAAWNVGGDFYQVFARGDSGVYFAIGDVSGKGISAALLMAQILSALHFVVGAASSPAHVLTQLNDTLSATAVRGMFATMLVGRMMPRARRVEIAGAGHCMPVIVRAGGSASWLETESALPVGVVPGTAYRQGDLELGLGDRLVFYTDGLTESRGGPDGALLGERIVSVLDRPFDSTGQIVDALVAGEAEYRGDGKQLDDLTILAGGFE